jgi:hypothetical protein
MSDGTLPYSKRCLLCPGVSGVAGLYSGLNFSTISLLIIALVYQLWLKYRQADWYRRYQYVSTSGVNAGAHGIWEPS